MENLGSQQNNFENLNIGLKKKMEEEMQSPQLKRNLQETQGVKPFKIKLTSSHSKEKEKEETKNDDEIIESKNKK